MSLISNISSLLHESRIDRVKVIVIIAGIIVGMASEIYKDYVEKQFENKNQTYELQVKTLSEIQASINNLSKFVQSQKEQLKQSKQTVDSLKEEQKTLKPVVEADRKIVESILLLQGQQQKANIWQERLIGFGLGIVGSLLASLIFAGIKRGRNA